MNLMQNQNEDVVRQIMLMQLLNNAQNRGVLQEDIDDEPVIEESDRNLSESERKANLAAHVCDVVIDFPKIKAKIREFKRRGPKQMMIWKSI